VVALWTYLPGLIAEVVEFSLLGIYNAMFANPLAIPLLIFIIAQSLVSEYIKDYETSSKEFIFVKLLLGGLATTCLIVLMFAMGTPYILTVIDLGVALDLLGFLAYIFINPFAVIAIASFGIYGVFLWQKKGELGEKDPESAEPHTLPKEVEEYLIPQEEILKHFSPITYNELEYKCIVSNFRILLYTADKVKFTEIDHRTISTQSLVTAKREEYVGGAIMLFLMGFFFLLLYFLSPEIGITGIWYIYLSYLSALGILCFLLGIICIYYYLTKAKYYLELHVGTETFQLFSTHNLLSNMINEVRQLKYSSQYAPERPVTSPAPPPAPTPQTTSPPASDPDTWKFCIHCGGQIRSIATFCDKCGKKQDV